VPCHVPFTGKNIAVGLDATGVVRLPSHIAILKEGEAAIALRELSTSTIDLERLSATTFYL